MGFTPSAITPYVDGSRVMDVAMLEALAEETGIPPGELVTRTGEEYRQLNADEAAVVRAMRLWPPSVRRALLAFVTFFANEPAVDRDAKVVAEYYRHFDAGQRRLLLGSAEAIDRLHVEPERIEQLARQVEDAAIAVGLRKPKARRAP